MELLRNVFSLVDRYSRHGRQGVIYLHIDIYYYPLIRMIPIQSGDHVIFYNNQFNIFLSKESGSHSDKPCDGLIANSKRDVASQI